MICISMKVIFISRDAYQVLGAVSSNTGESEYFVV